MEIERLLRLPESKTLEFKRDLSSINSILKTLVAFANTAGGILVIGTSSEGEILGIEDIFEAEEKIANAIADNINPPLLPEIEITTVEGKNLLIVKTPHWRGPFYLKKQGMPDGAYIRLGSTSRPAGPELLAELQRSVLHLSYDEEPLINLSKESLDLKKAKGLFESAQKPVDDEKLRSLGVLVSSPSGLIPSVGGLILFGHEAERVKFVPDARVSCARFRGDDKTEILDRLDVEGTILDAVEAVPKFIARNTRLSAEIESIRRKDIPEYSPVALREVLINALAHSDYSLTGSRIQVAIFSNRLEIQNPGMLPFGFTLEDLKAGVSRVRNRVIARVFSGLNLMEEWGSGYKRAIEACRMGGYPEPEWKELGTMIRVIFYPHSKSVLKEKSLSLKISTIDIDRPTEILKLFEEGKRLTFKEIYQTLGLPISERTLRYDLSELKNQGKLFSNGKGPKSYWEKAP